MKTINLILCAVLLLACASGAFAQASFTRTTLSSAVTSTSATVIYVTSATGITANTTGIYVDAEFMSPIAINGTAITVIRGAYGTQARLHVNASLVWIGNNNYFRSAPVEPLGSCTATAEIALPYINVGTGVISNCIGGQWVNGRRTTTPPFRVFSPPVGAVAWTGVNTNGTTLGATTLYCTETYLPADKVLTGIAVLNGTTVGTGTDKHNVSLYAGTGGAVLANSTAAGVASANASTYQEYAFTATYYAVAGTYYACMQTSSTTDTVRMAVTGVGEQPLTKGQTGATFATFPTLTVPTGFTTAVGPFIYLY